MSKLKLNTISSSAKLTWSLGDGRAMILSVGNVVISHPLMQNCDAVVESIKDTGQIKREQRDLEEQVSMSCMKHLSIYLN
jgi:hypothetical protein